MLNNDDKALYNEAVDFASPHGTNMEVTMILVALIKGRAIENAGNQITKALDNIARNTSR